MLNRHGDVLVIGAGPAGLAAAERLAGAGVDVQVLEAAGAVGGRVRGEPAGPAVHDTGAEFVGRPHRRLRALISSLGLHTEPSGLDRAPIRWRLPDRRTTSWLPPVPLPELRRLGRAWSTLRREALTLDPDQPWASPATAALDEVDLADWLVRRGVGRPGLDATSALLTGFATRPVEQLSAAHAAWWIAAAGGLLTALRSGQQYVVHGGAHQIPRRLAHRLPHHPILDTPVTAVRAHAGGVEVHTAGGTWTAGAVVVAVPLPALRRLEIDPAPPEPFTTAVRSLAYGTAVKIAGRAAVAPPVAHRTVLGGHPLDIAWRRGRTLAGISTCGTPVAGELAADLATAFGLRLEDLTAVTVTDWATAGGSYLAYGPGQLTRHAAALRSAGSARVRFAGADLSSWPNSMEGAVQSGQAAAEGLLAHPPPR